MKNSVRSWPQADLGYRFFLPCNLDAHVYRTYKKIMSHEYNETAEKESGRII